MSDDRAELLRTQAVQACLTAMGAAEIRVYGDGTDAGGVVLDSADTLTGHTLMWIGRERWRYETRVRVDVSRTKVDER